MEWRQQQQHFVSFSMWNKTLMCISTNRTNGIENKLSIYVWIMRCSARTVCAYRLYLWDVIRVRNRNFISTLAHEPTINWYSSKLTRTIFRVKISRFGRFSLVAFDSRRLETVVHNIEFIIRHVKIRKREKKNEMFLGAWWKAERTESKRWINK